MDARARELERHKLLTRFTEYAYSEDTVVHITHKSEVKTRWKREKEVGSGAFGTVYLEKDDVGELRAVKSLPRRMFKENVLREMHALVELRDYPDYFVRFLGWFEDKEFIFIAMEYTECGDLRKYMTDFRPKARREVREITGQLLEGLVVLHRRGFCHRDLNPQNVLIASFSPISVKIADFGVSKREIDTQLRTQCGTPGYRAPEQQGLLMTGKPYTNAADLWALGCLVHEILTSEIPFLYREVDFDTIVSGLEVEETAQAPDPTLLYKYCCGNSKFPTASLDKSVIGKEGINFVKRLLVVDPKCRPSASDALKSPWLSEENDSAALRDQLLNLGIQISLEVADYLILWRDERCVKEAPFDLAEKGISTISHASKPNGCLPVRNLDDISFDMAKLLLEKGGRLAGDGAAQHLWVAAASGDFDIVKLLLDRGTNVNARIYLNEGTRPKHSQSALHAAVEGGHYNVAQLLLHRGANANFMPTSDQDQTVLQVAAIAGHLSMINLLLDSGADVNARPWLSYDSEPYSGRTALEVAAASGSLNAVQLLLYREARVNAAAAMLKGRTALQAAAEGGHINVLTLLLKAGAETNAEPAEYSGLTALQAAAKGGHVDVVRLLLNSGAAVNAKPARVSGLTVLQAAAEGGHVNVVRLLLNSEAAVNAKPAEFSGLTALQAAAKGGHVDVVRLLLNSGAAVNAEPAKYEGLTALQAAAKGGHANVVRLLLSSGAAVNAEPAMISGLAALQAAANGGHIDVVRLLLNSGAAVNAEPAEDSCPTALQAAAGGGYVDVVKLLLNSGAAVNAKLAVDLKRGRTALGVAAWGGYFDVVELLLKAGAEVDAESPDPWIGTPLQVAAECGHFDTVKLLLDAGADATLSGRRGKTAAQLASENGHDDVVELFCAGMSGTEVEDAEMADTEVEDNEESEVEDSEVEA